MSTTKQGKRGFTIVELLIVIVIIAILAAITMVAYSGLTQRARESRVVLQLTQIRKQMDLHRTEYNEWPFQAGIDARVATGSSVGSAWCNAVIDYLYANNADSGAFDDGTGGNSCSTMGSRGCAAILVSGGAFERSKLFYISSEKLGVSAGTGMDDPPPTAWCWGS